MNKLVPWSLVGAMFALCASPSTAHADPSPPQLDGSFRMGYYSASRKLDDETDIATAALWLKPSWQVSDQLVVMAEGWRSDERGLVREAYAKYSEGDLQLRLGKQIIAWGRTDGINPTDNITPRDYTLLTPQDDDQRFGTTAANVSYQWGTSLLTGLWLPRFNPTVYPMAPSAQATISQDKVQAQQFAIKLDRTDDDVDWSVSYFRGRDLPPQLALVAGPTGSTSLALEHPRVDVFGLDAATNVGRYGLRTEMAYTQVSSSEAASPTGKKPFFYAVAGGDRTFYSYLYVNLQYYVRLVSKYQDPRDIADPGLRTVAIQSAVLANQLDRVQHGMTATIGDKWLNETLQGQVQAMYSLSGRDYRIKLNLSYAIDDKWLATVGGIVYGGPDNTFFQQLHRSSGAFAELRYGF